MKSHKDEALVAAGISTRDLSSMNSNLENEVPHQTDLAPLSDDAALRRISRFMKFVVKGRMTDMRSPLHGNRTSRRKIMNDWKKIWQTLDLEAEIKEMEKEWIRKAGPKSGVKPWAEVAEIYENYFKPNPSKVDQETLDLAVDAVIDYCGLRPYVGRLRRLSMDEAVAHLPKTTNWGLSEFRPGRVYKEQEVEKEDGSKVKVLVIVEDNLQIYIDQAIGMLNDPDHPGWKQGNMPFRRTDMGGPLLDDCKQRAVWGQPHAVSILDAMYVQPVNKLIKSIKARGLEALYNEDQLDMRIVQGLKEAEARNGYQGGEDIKAWDQHVPRHLISAGFALIGKLYQATELGTLKLLERYFAESGMLTPQGDLVGRTDCVSSGSGFTLLINSLMHMIMRFYAHLKLFKEKYEAVITVKGDDGTSFFADRKELERVAQVYKENFGMELELDKTYFEKSSTSFAKKLYLVDVNYGTPSSFRTLASALGYEHATPALWNGADDSIRWQAQLASHARVKHGYALVKFFMFGDKYRLGMALVGGFSELIIRSGGEEEVRRKLGLDAYDLAYRDYDPTDFSSPIHKLIEQVYNDNFSHEAKLSFEEANALNAVTEVVEDDDAIINDGINEEDVTEQSSS